MLPLPLVSKCNQRERVDIFWVFFYREISLEAHRMARTERLEDKDELVATEIGHGHIGN